MRIHKTLLPINPCGGGLEYPHCSPACRRWRRKGNPVPGGITWPHCHWGTYIQRPGPPGWGLDARLTTLLCKKLLPRNPKKWKPDGLIPRNRSDWLNLLRKTMDQQEVLGRSNRLVSLIRHGPYWKRCVQQFFYCCMCICYRGKFSIEPLPSNNRRIFTEPLASNDRGDTHTHTH
jgi:hypothetical protein